MERHVRGLLIGLLLCISIIDLRGGGAKASHSCQSHRAARDTADSAELLTAADGRGVLAHRSLRRPSGAGQRNDALRKPRSRSGRAGLSRCCPSERGERCSRAATGVPRCASPLVMEASAATQPRDRLSPDGAFLQSAFDLAGGLEGNARVE